MPSSKHLYLSRMPFEIMIRILWYLQFRDLLQLRRTSRQYKTHLPDWSPTHFKHFNTIDSGMSSFRECLETRTKRLGLAGTCEKCLITIHDSTYSFSGRILLTWKRPRVPSFIEQSFQDLLQATTSLGIRSEMILAIPVPKAIRLIGKELETYTITRDGCIIEKPQTENTGRWIHSCLVNGCSFSRLSDVDSTGLGLSYPKRRSHCDIMGGDDMDSIELGPHYWKFQSFPQVSPETIVQLTGSEPLQWIRGGYDDWYLGRYLEGIVKRWKRHVQEIKK